MSSHKGSVNEIHEITLPSSIERIEWAASRAAPGGSVGLEIFTRYVGNGATLQIKLSDHQGTTHGTFQNQIHNNHLSAEIQVPPKARDALFAEVKFPKHSLKAKSSPLLLTRPVRVKDPRWSAQEARRGDVLTLSATVEGAPDGTAAQVTIMEHDDDGAHDLISQFDVLIEDGRIETEWAYEYHEDTDDIPTEAEAENGYTSPEYFFRVDVEGVAAQSDVLAFKDWVEFVLTDRFERPRKDVEEITLKLPDGKEVTEKPDERGRVVLKDVPPGAIQVVSCKTKKK